MDLSHRSDDKSGHTLVECLCAFALLSAPVIALLIALGKMDLPNWLNIPLEIVVSGVGLASIFRPEWAARTMWRQGKLLADSDSKRESPRAGGLLLQGMSALHGWLNPKQPADSDSKRESIKDNGLFLLGMAACLAWTSSSISLSPRETNRLDLLIEVMLAGIGFVSIIRPGWLVTDVLWRGQELTYSERVSLKNSGWWMLGFAAFVAGINLI